MSPYTRNGYQEMREQACSPEKPLYYKSQLTLAINKYWCYNERNEELVGIGVGESPLLFAEKEFVQK